MTIEKMEYRRFHGQLVLLPQAGDEPIRDGTGYTQTQLEAAQLMQRTRDIFGLDVFMRLNELRERRLRGELTDT